MSHVITPAQCRAGRALLGITQTELAAAAGIGLTRILDFEKGRGATIESVERIVAALEARGIVFIEEASRTRGVKLMAEPAVPVD